MTLLRSIKALISSQLQGPYILSLSCNTNIRGVLMDAIYQNVKIAFLVHMKPIPFQFNRALDDVRERYPDLVMIDFTTPSAVNGDFRMPHNLHARPDAGIVI